MCKRNDKYEVCTVHTSNTAFIASTAYTVETAFEQKGYNAYIL